jgi:hypothetical protein
MAAAGATTAIEPAEGAPGPALVLPTETHRQIEDIVKKSGDRYDWSVDHAFECINHRFGTTCWDLWVTNPIVDVNPPSAGDGR